MRTTACWLVLVATAIGSGAALAEDTPQAALLVLSKRDRTLAIVDPATLKAVAKIPVGNDPHEVIASTDGKTAYVSNYGFGAYNTLATVDLVGQKAMTPIDLGPLRGPHGLVFTRGKTWFTAEGAKAIGSYDPAQHKVDWILGTGQDRTHMIWVSADGKRILTTNVSSASVSIIEKSDRRPGMPPPPPPSAGPGQGGPSQRRPNGPPHGAPPMPPGGSWEETVVKVGGGSEGFDVSPDGAEMWVANAQDGSISIIDLAAKKVKETIAADLRGANRLKFTPDGKRVFVSGPGLAVIDAHTHKPITHLDIGHAAGIQMQPDGARAYVACSGEDYVAAIDLKTLTVTGKIDGGPEPDGLAWAVHQ